MTIDDLINKGTLVKQPTSQREIADLIKIVERDIKDSANTDVSYDWQFGIAYNAALKLATILVRRSGYRVKGQGHHMNTFALVPLILDKSKQDDRDYLDTCRRKRNTIEYTCVGGATKEDVEELREFVLQFQKEVHLFIKDETFD